MGALSCVFMAKESWRSNAVISTNQSTVSGWIWTNESAPLCLADNAVVVHHCWGGAADFLSRHFLTLRLDVGQTWGQNGALQVLDLEHLVPVTSIMS